jgi:hypothetical protein
MFFLLPLSTLFLIGIFVLFGQISFAQFLSNWFFISLFAIVFYQFMSHLKFSVLIEKRGISTLYKKLILHHRLLIFISVVCIFIFAAFSTTYYFGGDDTRLYFLYPNEYYSHFVSSIVGDNTLSNIGNFLPSSSISFFLFSLIGAKALWGGINLQTLFYVLNIFCGIFFFYKLMEYIFKTDFPSKKIILILSSCMYVFSIFNFYTLFNSRLTAVFLISILPLSVFLFLKACKEKKIHLIALIAVLVTISTVTSIASLWFLAAILVLLPFLLYLLRESILRVVLYGAILLVFIILLNLNWLVFLGHTTLTKKTGGEASNSIVSQNFIEDNANGVRSTVSGNSFFYPLLNSYHRGIQENNNWPYLPIYRSWYQTLLPLNLFFILTIFFAGVVGRKNKTVYSLYLFASLSLFIALYLFTIVAGETTYGNLGINTFVWLINHIPGFVIFRNMYDKFGLGLSFSFAILFAISVRLLFDILKNERFKTGFLISTAFLILLIAKPFLFGEFDKLPIWTTRNLYQGTTSFNEDYLNLVNFVKSQEYHGRYAFIPLSGGNVIPIQDKYKPDHYYVGVSPLLILTGKNDYSGTLSFGEYDKDLYFAIYDHDYEKAGTIFQNMNVAYVIVNKDVPAELQSSYMYEWRFFDAQRDEFLQTVAGQKIQDFGSRYSLYTINDTYKNEKIELRNTIEDPSDLFSDVTYQKVASYEYHATLKDVTDMTYLSFFEENDSGWILKDATGKTIPLQKLATNNPYRNTWLLDKQVLSSFDGYKENNDGTATMELTLYFQPYDYYLPSLIFTLISFVVLIFYVIWSERNYIISKIKRI